MNEQMHEVIVTIQDLEQDDDVPRNVREKMRELRESLTAKNANLSLIINKSLVSLDQLAEDNNLQGFIRTQIWNISSLLEKLQG